MTLIDMNGSKAKVLGVHVAFYAFDDIVVER